MAARPGASAAAAQPGKLPPIEIGFVVTNTSNAGSFGINTGQTYTDQQLYSSLVAAINAAGGMGGRQIKPVYATTDTASSSWTADFQAACATFTQDNHVAAVIGYIFVYEPAFEQCLAQAGVPHLFGGYQPGDAPAQKQFSSLVATTDPSTDGQFQIGLTGAVTSGVLTPQHKLGVVLDDCANDAKAFARVGAPYLQSQHITYQTVDGGCANGSSDDAAAVSAIQNAELQFRANGVDTVYVSGVPALLFAEDAESQGWHPSYVMTDAGAAFEGNVPPDQLQNFHGFGWIPSVDVNPSNQPYPASAAEAACLRALEGQGLTPKAYNDFFELYTTCDGLDLYGAALTADGGQTASAAVVSALASVYGKVALASTYGGLGRYTADQHGGPAEYRQWGWAGACSCFRYSGPTYPIS